MPSKTFTAVIACALYSVSALGAHAGTVTGGALLSNTDADQLETWLGSGDLDFTNIWSGDAGVATVSSFHAAADGVGPTFSLFDITNGDGSNAIIGGYTQADWGTSTTLGYNTYVADSTAFIFNFAIGEMQKIEADQASNAIYSDPDYFANFGSGFDLFAGWGVLGTMNGVVTAAHDGKSRSAAYDLSQGQITVAGDSGFGHGDSGVHYNHWSVNSLEVYTFAPAALPPVPIPAGLPLMAGALGLLAWIRRRPSRSLLTDM